MEREFIKMGLAVIESNTKCMLSTNKYMRLIEFQITVNNCTSNIVHNFFIYLSSNVTSKSDVSLKIKHVITVANRCYFGLNRQLSGR